MEMKQVYIEQMYRMRMSVYERLNALKSIIYNYVSENGGTVEIPDEQDEGRDINTPMAVMDDFDNIADAYIEGIRTDGQDLVIWGTRTDGAERQGNVRSMPHLMPSMWRTSYRNLNKSKTDRRTELCFLSSTSSASSEWLPDALKNRVNKALSPDGHTIYRPGGENRNTARFRGKDLKYQACSI